MPVWGHPLGEASICLNLASEDSLPTTQPQGWALRSPQPVSCTASPTFVVILLEGLWGMDEEASDPRPEFSGLHPSRSQTASGYKGSQRAELWAKVGLGAGSGWTIVRPLIGRLIQGCTS